MLLVFGALTGCMNKEMKSTPFYEGTQVVYKGDAKDRINLWPVAYWRNPVGSVAWPLLSFSDDLFAVRPLYSQYKQDGADGDYDEFNFLWPLCQADTKHEDYRIFPFFWGKTWSYRTPDDKKNYQAVFPIYWNGPHYNALYPLWIYRNRDDRWSFYTIGGLAGATKAKDGYRSSWCFPLWYENNEGVLATTLFGYAKDSRWVFPLWYHDEDSVISLLYASGRSHNDPDDTWWASPGLLSWGGRNVSKRTDEDGVEKTSVYTKGRILLGLGGWEYDNYSSGNYSSENWIFPLYFRDVSSWDAGTNVTTKTSFLCSLIGWKHTTKDGEGLYESHVYPLYDWEYYDEKYSHFYSILGGWSNDEAFVTPFVGFKRAKSKESGGWVFPIWSHTKDRDYDEMYAKLFNASVLPEEVKISSTEHTNKVGAVESVTWSADGRYRSNDTTWFLLADNHRSISVSGWDWIDVNKTEVPEARITYRHKLGNILFLNYESEREANYDMRTREKVADEESAEGSFLVWLYQYDYARNRMKDETYRRHRVLWKLWDWEESNGDVSLDVFPGFTYDRKKDGSTKTSLLWRLFRYESDPKAGTSIDLLFIPVWR